MIDMSFIKKIKDIGFLHVFSASVINKIVALACIMIIVRLVSKTDYGLYSFAYNIISIILIFADGGTKLARFQYCCECEDFNERKAITIFLARIGFATNLLFSICTIIYASIVPLSIPDARPLLQGMAFLLVVQYFYELVIAHFRIEKNNKLYATLTNINTLLYAVVACVTIWLIGINGIIVGLYVSFAIPIFVGLIWIRRDKLGRKSEKVIISRPKKLSMIKYGLLVMATNSVSSVLHYFDTFFVGLIVADSMVLAEYKVAITIPNALSFIPAACITMIYPYFVSHMNDKKWIAKNTKKMQLLLAIPNACITVFCIFFAREIIVLIFGNPYVSAIYAFRIMMITYFFSSTFRVIYGNVLSMLHLIKVNFWLGMIECTANIITDVVLIRMIGSVGAAYSTLIITILSSIMSGVYFHYYVNKKECA